MMDTEMIQWGWCAALLLVLLGCWTGAFSAAWYMKGQHRGRCEGYGFAKNPTHEEFHGVPYSIVRVIDDDDYAKWRDSLGKEDLL